MKLEQRKLADIRPYENNPRKNDEAVAAVMESIRQCGYISPIVVDENGVILAGHTRYKALRKLRRKVADVVEVSGLTDEQKRKFRVLDNKTGEIAEWDDLLLRVELEGLDFGNFDFGLTVADAETVEVSAYERRKASSSEDVPELGTIPETSDPVPEAAPVSVTQPRFWARVDVDNEEDLTELAHLLMKNGYSFTTSTPVE